MGSPAELEVHAYFHNYHSKLKFVGSQALRSRPDLPPCSQVAPSSSLHPEGSEELICQWENCDVGASSSSKSRNYEAPDRNATLTCPPHRRAPSPTQSGSTDTSTITWKAPSCRRWANSSSLSSASGQVRLRHPLLPPSAAVVIHPLFTSMSQAATPTSRSGTV